MFAASYSIFRPAFSATTPSSITSVSFEAYSNGHDAAVFPLAASTQFISWFSCGIRGSFSAGLPYDLCSESGSRRGFLPYVSCISLPLLPMRIAPPVGLRIWPSGSSTGLGGRSPPSYHVSFTPGFPLRAGNSYIVIVAFGKHTLLNGVETVSIVVGYPRSSAHIEWSMRCAPMSPIAPQPQSTQPRQLNGWYTG